MRIAVFDTETTGLPLHHKASLTKQPYIIEYAVAHIDKGKITNTFSTLIKPPVPVSDEITKITGITNDDLADAPDFPAAFPIIQQSLKGVDVLLAHNMPFDEQLLQMELNRHSLILDWPPSLMCTVQMYMEEYGRRVKLLDLYERKLGRPLHQTHRALDDVLALCEIIIHEKLWKVL